MKKYLMCLACLSFLLTGCITSQESIREVILVECEEKPLIPCDKKEAKISISAEVFFDFDRYSIKEEAKKELDEFAEALIKDKDIKVKIDGHTDSIGTEEYNYKLSLRRAESIKNYLIAKGIEIDRLSTEGYGESKPIAPNTTKEGRAKNRRVEFILTRDETNL